MKGKTNNPNGRPAGVPNRLTKELRNILKDIVSQELENMPGLLNKLEPEKRLEILVKLLAYVLPKIEPVQAKQDEPSEFGLDLFDTNGISDSTMKKAKSILGI